MAEITALVPWFGANRMLARRVGEELLGSGWVGIPFAGSMTELRHIKARTMAIADAHRHLINLARVAGCPLRGPELYRRLRRRIFHPDELADAQATCMRYVGHAPTRGLFAEGVEKGAPRSEDDSLTWAEAYFVTCWMARSAIAGTGSEFTSGIATRWTASGGDSATRYQSAVRALPAWRRLMRRCTIEVMDAFAFIDRTKDHIDCALYCDPPWLEAGYNYEHDFGIHEHHRLADMLGSFDRTRVVIRYGDHPLIRELYPPDKWTWIVQRSRNQGNSGVDEVLLINGPAIGKSDDE